MRFHWLKIMVLGPLLGLALLSDADAAESLASRIHRALQCASSFGKVENTRIAIQQNQGQRVAFRGTYTITTFGVVSPGNFSGYAKLNGQLIEVTWSETTSTGKVAAECLR